MLCFATIIINAQTNNFDYLKNELDFEQAIFSNANNLDSVNRYLFNKANFFKQNNEFNKAIRTLARINENDLTDSIKFEYYYQLSILNYLTNNFTEVDLLLNKVNHFIADTIYKNKLILLQILNLNHLQKWSEGKNLLISQLKIKTDSNLINEWYKDALKFRPKKQKTAQALQTFFPGLGQIYAGKTIHGVINAGLILTGLAWGGYNFYNGYYFTGTFTGFLISYMFYSGGIAYAMDQAEKFNSKKIKDINQLLNSKVLNYL
jgi:tetratricopeptide (TPR) repeat protein